MIPLCVPVLSGNEWTYVKDCLDTNWVSSVGSYVDRFEADMARAVGTAHAVATVNGTAALQVALQVAGVEAGDEVLVPALTFIATANAPRYLGAWPVIIDVDSATWQMDPVLVSRFLDEGCERVDGALRNRATGRRVAAIMPVHVLGHPADMDPILEAARRHGVPVIEDATESLGASYKGRKIGSLADISCFSFNGNKLITTGGGGMICTGNAVWAKRAKYLTTQAKDDPLEYEHGEVGYNYRLVNILAAIGCAQLERLDEAVAAKRRIAARYNEALAAIPGLTPMPTAPWADSACWLYTMLVDPQIFGMDARALMAVLGQQQIQTRPLWQPMHLSPAHAGAPAIGGEVAELLYRNALSLPCSVSLTEEDQQRVIKALGASASRA